MDNKIIISKVLDHIIKNQYKRLWRTQYAYLNYAIYTKYCKGSQKESKRSTDDRRARIKVCINKYIIDIDIVIVCVSSLNLIAFCLEYHAH